MIKVEITVVRDMVLKQEIFPASRIRRVSSRVLDLIAIDQTWGQVEFSVSANAWVVSWTKTDAKSSDHYKLKMEDLCRALDDKYHNKKGIFDKSSRLGETIFKC